MDLTTVEQLRKQINFASIADPNNVALLRGFSAADREEFSRLTHSPVLYLGDEVAACRQAEEHGALRAAPPGHLLRDLNGLNIGCGDRLVSPYLTAVDIMRQPPLAAVGGEHGALTPGAFLALPDALPFRPNSVDYIISLHSLEHMADPVGVVLHWIDILKPGGGVGVVVPDWRYAWDARHDGTPFGHKWNPTPRLVRSLHDKHWACRAELESLQTYEFKLSFDFVLRKPGIFEPFSSQGLAAAASGRQLAEAGHFIEE